MSLHTFVSFEPEIIRVVTARCKSGRMILDRALTLSSEEFDLFLKRDRSSDYQIIINSPDAVFDTITIPPVKPKLINTIVQSEVRRSFPGQPAFTAAFRTIDEIFADNRTMLRIACCMVPDELLFSVLEPFMRCNKPVSRILTVPVILAHLAEKELEDSKRTMLCAYDSGNRKNIFLLENGCVTLVRHVPSEGHGWDSIDLQNVSMTMDYCFQSLRVRPTKSIAFNGINIPQSLQGFDSALATAYPDLFQEYLPLLATMELAPTEHEDLRPQEYLAEHAHQNLIRQGTRIFAAAAAIVIVLLLGTLYSVISLRNTIDLLRRQEQSLPAILSNYQAVQQEYSAIEPMIALITKFGSEPSLPVLISRFPEAGHGAVRITALNAKKDGGNSTITITGRIMESSFAALQNRFEEFTAVIEKIQGISITSKLLDTKEKSFTIEAAFKQ